MPFSQKQHTGIIDNLFTAVSAVSTTGLATVSIADNYTFFGQLVVIILVQLGGIGYMTVSSFLVLSVTHHFTRTENYVLKSEFTFPDELNLQSLIRGIVIFTFAFQFFGAIALYITFYSAGVPNSVWLSIFHSISAFCTAGFGLYNDSFEQFKLNTSINIILSILSYAGGIGFIVLLDFARKIRNRKCKITFTSKAILLLTLLLTIYGTLQLYIFEPSIQNLDSSSKLTVSLFQTMSAITTVGFNTVPIATLHASSLMIIIILMYIGASPSGTGGGLKSTTIIGIFAYVKSRLSISNDVSIFGNIIPKHRYRTALSLFILYTSILLFATYLMTFTEPFSLMELLFESASALGTVGLSTGVTGYLTPFGKIVIIFLMFIGRVGVITIGNALLIKQIKREQIMRENDLAI